MLILYYYYLKKGLLPKQSKIKKKETSKETFVEVENSPLTLYTVLDISGEIVNVCEVNQMCSLLFRIHIYIYVYIYF